MIKAIIAIFILLAVIEIIYFTGRGIAKGINETHNWEETPDKAEKEARK